MCLKKINELKKKLASDSKLREKLRSNPGAALAEVGVNVGSRRVIVHEVSAGSMNIVLPVRQESWDNSLQNAEINKLAAAAYADAKVKALLLSNPQAAVKQVLGKAYPFAKNLKAFANSDKELHLVLPKLNDSGELNDQELAKVAGGGFGDIVTAVCVNAQWIGQMVGTTINCTLCCVSCTAFECSYNLNPNNPAYAIL